MALVDQLRWKILALDLSLTGTGLASYDHEVTFSTLRPPKTAKDGMPRMHWILDEIKAAVSKLRPFVVVMEEMAFAAHDRGHERAGLAFLVRYFLWTCQIPYVLVAPTTLKKFTSGSGKAEKSMMILEVFKRWGYSAKNDNEADALSLLRIGMTLTGKYEPENNAQKEVIALVCKNNPEVLKACSTKSK